MVLLYQLGFSPLVNAPVYVDIDQGIYKEKLKVAQNEKRKNFSYT